MTRGPAPQPLEARFWPKVNKAGLVVSAVLGPCWEWLGGTKCWGYGLIYDGPHKMRRAHIVSYTLLVGPVPVGMVLDHLCRVRHCVNPRHLEPVTQKVNSERGIRATKTHCIRGHEFTLDNTYRARGRRYCKQCRNLHSKWSESRRRTLASKIWETEPVIREINIEGYAVIARFDVEGIHIHRKGDKTRGEAKPHLHVKWGDVMEIGAEKQGVESAYKHLGFDE